MAGRRSKLPLLAFGLTLLGLVLAVAVRDQLIGRSSGARVAVPTPLSSAASVGGWRGPAALGLIYAPLHTDPERQSFDAGVLAERLGMQAGQPFRLELEGLAADKLAALVSAARSGQLTIEDQAGRAAELLHSSSTAGSPGARPIRALFAPDATLDASDGGRLVFWGRPLEAGARIVGPDFEWKLSPSAVPRGDLPLFVASRSLASDSADR